MNLLCQLNFDTYVAEHDIKKTKKINESLSVYPLLVCYIDIFSFVKLVSLIIE